MDWLVSHRDTPYEAMDLVKAVIEIEKETPVAQETSGIH